MNAKHPIANPAKLRATGHLARNAGQPIESCPHEAGSEEATIWAQGWHRCDMQLSEQPPDEDSLDDAPEEAVSQAETKLAEDEADDEESPA